MRGDVGGIDSEITSQSLSLFGYKFNENITGGFGYRLMGYEIDEGSSQLNLNMRGLVVGVAFGF